MTTRTSASPAIEAGVRIDAASRILTGVRRLLLRIRAWWATRRIDPATDLRQGGHE
jgi:hypothetical protein